MPSSLGLYEKGTGIAEDLGGVFTRGVAFDDSRIVISRSLDIFAVVKREQKI